MPKLASRLSKGGRQYDREVDKQPELPFDKLTDWMIVQRVTVGIVLAAALNVLIEYL